MCEKFWEKKLNPDNIGISKEDYNYEEIMEVNDCEVHLLGTEHSSIISTKIISEKIERNDFDFIMPELGKTGFLSCLFIFQNSTPFSTTLSDEERKEMEKDLENNYPDITDNYPLIKRKVVDEMYESIKNRDSYPESHFLTDMYFCVRKSIEEDIPIRCLDAPKTELDLLNSNDSIFYSLYRLFKYKFTQKPYIEASKLEDLYRFNYFVKGIIATEIEPEEFSKYEGREDIIEKNLSVSAVQNMFDDLPAPPEKLREEFEENILPKIDISKENSNTSVSDGERESFMVASINQSAKQNDRILAVIGMGHFCSVRRLLNLLEKS